MKLLDFLKSLNGNYAEELSAIDLEQERHALLAELHGVLDLLDTIPETASALPAELCASVRTIDLNEVFDADHANIETTPATEAPQRQLAQSLIEELRQLQQRVLEGR